MSFPMSLRWSWNVAPKFLKKGSKTQNGRFCRNITLRLKNVCYNVSLCENCQRQSCKAFIGLTIRAKMIGGAIPSTWNFGSNWPRWEKIADFRSIFARSASAVTPSEKSSINTIIGSTLRAFQWAQDKPSYVFPKPPCKEGEKHKVSKFWTVRCDNSETIDRKSHTGFRLFSVVALKTLVISQGSEETRLRCGGIFSDSIITHFLLILRV